MGFTIGLKPSGMDPDTRREFMKQAQEIADKAFSEVEPDPTPHVIAKNDKLSCLHCGSQRRLTFPIKITDLIAENEAFGTEHADCQNPGGTLCLFCFVRGHNYLVCPYVRTTFEWSTCEDVGMSASAIYAVQGGASEWWNNPHDADDFGRCYRLVKRFPELLVALEWLATMSRPWRNIHRGWDTLCALHETKDWKRLSEALAKAEGR